jgi:hypothetical protein
MFQRLQSAFLMRAGLHNHKKRYVSSLEHIAPNERETRPTVVAGALEPQFPQKAHGGGRRRKSHGRPEVHNRLHGLHEPEAQSVLQCGRNLQ